MYSKLFVFNVDMSQGQSCSYFNLDHYVKNVEATLYTVHLFIFWRAPKSMLLLSLPAHHVNLYRIKSYTYISDLVFLFVAEAFSIYVHIGPLIGVIELCTIE